MSQITVDLPATFYFDHIGRDLPGGTVVRRLANNRVRVCLTESDAREILSDARHYASDAMDDMYADDFAHASGLIRSAKATVRILTEAGA